MADRTSYRFVLRGNTAAGAAASDLPMLEKEIGYETDTGRSKVGLPGDATKYRDIPHYFTPGSYKLDGLAHGQGFKWDATLGLMVPTELGKTYQPGTGISIDNPTSATPTINSTLGSIALSGRKEDYAHLPTGLGPTDDGKAYILDSDNLVYIWNGSAFPAEGDGKAISSGGGDPYWDNVASLLLFNDVADPWRDEKGNAWSVASGTPVLSSAHVKFGPYAMRVTGGTEAIKTTNLDLIRPLVTASMLWTLETWFYVDMLPPATQLPNLCGSRLTPTGGFAHAISRTSDPNPRALTTYITDAGAPTLVRTTTPVTVGGWHHSAACAFCGQLLTFFDGVLVEVRVGTASNANSTLTVGALPYADAANVGLNGYIDSFRLTIGVARYTSNFTPPSAPFPRSR